MPSSYPTRGTGTSTDSDDEPDPTWAPLREYPQDLQFYLGAIDGVRCLGWRHYGHAYARAAGDDEYAVLCLGSGGGFCWEREFDRQRLFRYARNTIDADTKIASESVDAICPSKYLGGGGRR